MGCCQAKAFDPLAVAEEDRTPSQEPAAAVASPAGVQVVEEAAPQEEEEEEEEESPGRLSSRNTDWGAARCDQGPRRCSDHP